MNTQDKFELFIEGLLSEEETRELKKQLNDDPVLFNEYKKYVEAAQLLKRELSTPLLSDNDDELLESLSLRQRLMIDEDVTEHLKRQKQDLYKDENKFRELLGRMVRNKSKGGTFSKIYSFFKIAAVFILVFIIAVAVFENIDFSSKLVRASDLYLKFYDPVNDEIFKSFASYNVILQKAIIAFRNADYAVANSSLDEISNDYDTEYKYHILKGLILLEKGESGKAKELLKTAMEKSNTDSRFAAEWYLGLAFLKENNTPDALPLLSDLSDNNNPYQKRAKEILRKLKRE